MPPDDHLQLEAATVDLSSLRILRSDGEELRLTPSEAALVRFLVAHPGRVIGREELLQEVWGYKPGVRSRTVDTTIGRLRHKLEADPQNPDHLVTVYGSGFRFDAPGLEAPGLFGRLADMRVLADRVADHRLVTLVGAGGVGKTSLARVWASQQHEVVWIDLSGAHTQTDFIGAVVGAVGGKLLTDDPIDGAIGPLARRPFQLVLDNLDTVTAAAATCLARWVPEAPELRIVGTSRSALGIEAESVIELTPLAPHAAQQLFTARAREVDPTLDVPEAYAAAIAEQLDGLPLAIELAAARLRVLSLDVLAERTTDFGHATLMSSVQRSWDLLQPAHRRVLSALALFAASFDAEAAEAVAAEPGLDTVSVLELLAGRSLLQASRGDLALYESVRQFARQHPPEPAVVARWARWLADRTGARWARDQGSAIEQVRASAPELALRLLHPRVREHVMLGENRAALQATEHVAALAAEAPDGACFGWLARSTALHAVGRYDEAVQAARRARETAPADMVARCWFEEARCHLAYARLDDLSEALDQAEAATTDSDLLLRIAVHRVNLARLQGRTEEALARLRDSMERFRGAPVTVGLATLTLNYGGALMESGRPDQAEAILLRAAALADELDRPSLRMLCDCNRAEALRSQGRFDEARPLYDAALDGVRAGRGLAVYEPILLTQLSALEQEAGDLNRAALLANQAVLAAGSSARYRAIAMVQVGGVHHERGWTLRAREAYQEGRDDLLEVGDERVAALVEARLASLEAATDLERAREWMALAKAHARDDAQLAATHALFAGHIAVAEGECVDDLLARVDQPVPGDPAPSPAAWNPEVRFAAKLLRRAASSPIDG